MIKDIKNSFYLVTFNEYSSISKDENDEMTFATITKTGIVTGPYTIKLDDPKHFLVPGDKIPFLMNYGKGIKNMQWVGDLANLDFTEEFNETKGNESKDIPKEEDEEDHNKRNLDELFSKTLDSANNTNEFVFEEVDNAKI